MPFLSQSNMSKEGLGFLVISPFTEKIASEGQIIRFPAVNCATKDPILVSAVLIQKGAKKVLRTQPTTLHAITQVKSQAVKMLVYRDQVTVEWSDLIAQPVRYIIDAIPSLRKCQKDSCSCGEWHASDAEPEGPIMDVWQWSYVITLSASKAARCQSVHGLHASSGVEFPCCRSQVRLGTEGARRSKYGPSIPRHLVAEAKHHGSQGNEGNTWHASHPCQSECEIWHQSAYVSSTCNHARVHPNVPLFVGGARGLQSWPLALGYYQREPAGHVLAMGLASKRNPNCWKKCRWRWDHVDCPCFM